MSERDPRHHVLDAVKTTARIGGAGLAMTGVGVGVAGALLWKYLQPKMSLAGKNVNPITRSFLTRLVRDATREFHQDRGVTAA